MLQHPMHPRSVLALQEVGGCLFRELSLRLPDFMHIFPKNADEQKIEDIFIVDTRIFDILDSEISQYTFSHNTIIRLTLREKVTGLKYCFIQSHVPGGLVNSLPPRIELAEKVMQEYNAENISIVLGDMNRFSDYFLPQFEQAAKKMGLAVQPFINMDIYSIKLKMRNFGCAKASGFNDRKWAPITNRGPFAIVESRELSRCPNSHFELYRVYFTLLI